MGFLVEVGSTRWRGAAPESRQGSRAAESKEGIKALSGCLFVVKCLFSILKPAFISCVDTVEQSHYFSSSERKWQLKCLKRKRTKKK